MGTTAATPATTAPGCATRSTSCAATPRPSTCHRRATAHPPGSASPSAYEDLQRGAGFAETETGETLSGATLRRICCDAEIIPLVLGLTQRGPRRRPPTTPGHSSDLESTRRPRQALPLPELHPTTVDDPRPPHHPLGERRTDLVVEPDPPVRASPPTRPLRTLEHPKNRTHRLRLRPTTRHPPDHHHRTRTTRLIARSPVLDYLGAELRSGPWSIAWAYFAWRATGCASRPARLSCRLR